MLPTDNPLGRLSGPPVLVLSVLALLAFACVPALAKADSQGFQYQDTPPTVSGGAPEESDLSGGGSSTSGVGGGSGGDGSGSGAAGGSGKGGAAGAKGSGGGSGSNGVAGVGEGVGLPGTGTDDGSASEVGTAGGGSSPLVPILIAIAVLAAASIGYVLYRQRRGGDGTSAGQRKPGDDKASGSSSSVRPEAS